MFEVMERGGMDERRFHVIVLDERTGQQTQFSHSPVTYKAGAAWLKKITDYPWRRKMLVEVSSEDK